jgi:flagellar protein FlgJ
LAISPPSDIVLDVARAAEPSAVASARAELLRRTQGAAAGIAFEPETAPTRTTFAAPLGRTASSESMPEASKKFEAMVLQTFIASMMPKNAEGTYGEGIAGEMWKGLMAEKIADVVAERGGIGIADRVLGDFQMRDEAKVAVAGVTSQEQLAEGGRPAMVAEAFVDLIQRQLAEELGAGAAPAETGLFKE